MTGDAAAFPAANRKRRRIRRWVALGTLPLTLAAFLLAVKLLSMYPLAHQAIVSHVMGDHSGTVRAGQGQEFLNIVERHKAPFNHGVGLASAGQLPEARAKFEEALDLASGLDVCPVRVNLALVIERMGDLAAREGAADKAMALYGEALLITIETPPECDSPEADQASSDPDRSLQDTLDDLEERLRDKQQQSGQPPGQPEGPEPQEPAPGPTQEQLDELQRRLEQGAEERQQHERGDDDGPGAGTDRPW